MRKTMTSLVLAAAVCGPAHAAAPGRQCFRSQDYQGFRPIDEHAFIVRANVNAYFRIDVQGSCPELTSPQAALVTTVRGTSMICDPLDWDLKVGQFGPGGFFTGCIVKSQRKLTPAEVASLPPKQKP